MESGRESVAQCLEAVEKAVEALLSAPSQADAPTDWRALASRLNGLHAQMFGIASMDDPALALKGIQDGGVLHEAVHDCLRALPVSAALSRPALPAEPTFREIRPEEVTFGRHRDVLGADELEAIRRRHTRAMHLNARPSEARVDCATLLRLLDAARAALAEERAKRGEMTEIAVNNAAKLHAAKAELAGVREAAHNREVAVHDRAYAYGFRAGWNEGVMYEQCQEVQFERKASGNPQAHLNVLAAMDDRIAAARAALAKDAP
jgi:predicted DNA-binding protein (UPF0251 family)